jgi:hypothetical protein
VTEGRPAPGDSRPRTLERPPGERYARPTGTGGAAGVAPSDRRPNLLVGAARGVLAGLAVALVIAVIVGVLDLGLGLLAVAALGGWLIGTAARSGSWSHRAPGPQASVQVLALALAIATWLGGEVGAYLFSLLLRPDSALTFGDRLRQSPFLEWLGPQLGIREILEVLLICGVAWYASRSPRDAA